MKIFSCSSSFEKRIGSLSLTIQCSQTFPAGTTAASRRLHSVCSDEPPTNFSYTRPEDRRDSIPGDERFLRACGVRPPDVRDELRVLDR